MRLQSSVTPQTIITSSTYAIPTETAYKHNFAWGIAFDLALFNTLFGKPASPTLP